MHRSNSNGFSLIEIMVSLAISAIFMAGILQVVMGSHATHRINEELAVMQENARLAMSILTDEIRMAGYLGCANPMTSGLQVDAAGNADDINQFLVNPINPVYPLIFGETVLSNVMLTGLDGDNISWGNTPYDDSNTEPGNIAENSIGSNTNSDILIVQHAEKIGSPVSNISISGAAPTATASITITNNNTKLEDGEGNLAIITDCKKIDLFYTEVITGNVVIQKTTNNENTASIRQNFTTASNISGEVQAQIHRFDGNIFHVDIKGSSKLPTLFRSDLYNIDNTVEVVRGIESIQIQYGVYDPATKELIYSNATNIAPAAKILSVKIAILARSYREIEAANGARTKNFSMLDVDYQVSDSYLRSVYISTIKLRNQRVEL